jgi:hypothetical protein
MQLGDALECHARVAHALIDHWGSDAELQRLLDQQLGNWESFAPLKQFIPSLIQLLQMNGACAEPVRLKLEQSVSIDVASLIGEMFQRSVDVARDLYDFHAGSWLGGAPQLKYLPFGMPIHPEPGAFGSYGVSGECTPGVKSGNAQVCLSLAVPRLGPPTWAAIPYVLLHELLCHASQRAESNREDDPFSEGWMDDVAKLVHATKVGLIFPWAPAFAGSEGGMLCEQLRRPTQLTNTDRTRQARSARKAGVEAAEATREALAGLAGLKGTTGDELFICLSIRLNLVASPPTEVEEFARHARFVEAVRSAAINEKSGSDRSTMVRYRGLLRSWVLDRATPDDVLSFT